MINVLSYIGMGLPSEVCLWTLLGLIRTIFDATLFKVNANLKQVWQMSMPEELSLHVQRVLRTMISGVMLVQCFTVYVYLASYIVLLYPVFLEERPILLLPWLLLAAIRKLLCELTSLALGLGTCVLLGPARPPCIKFVVIKVISIMPSFYMWMLVYSYYHALKVASVFKTFPAVLPTSELNYGLELAIRRRRAKSLLGEDQLRKSLRTNFYNGTPALKNIDTIRLKTDYSSRMTHATDTSAEELKEEINNLTPVKIDENSPENENTPVCYEDWLGSEVMIPRDTDRILEQFGLMMLRISAYLTKEGTHNNNPENILPTSESHERKGNYMNCTAMPPDNTDTPPLVANSGARTASYLRDYPQIFQKKTEIPLTLGRDNSIGHPSVSLRNKSQEGDDDSIYHKWANSLSSQGSIQVDTSSSKKSQSDTESNNIIKDKPSEKGVDFSDKTKNTTQSQEETDFKQMSDGIEKLIDNCLNSQDSSKSIKDESNSQHYQSDNENYPTKSGLKTKNKFDTNSNQTLNELEIKILSITSLEPSDEGIETSSVDKATSTSTQHTKKRTKGLKNNKKQ